MRVALLRDPLLLGAALIPIVISVHGLRYLMRLGDEGIIPHGAVRILGGQVIYRDFFEFLSPGGFLLVAAWMELFGTTFVSLRVLAVGIIAAVTALLYLAARLASGERWLPALLAIAWALPRAPMEISHHWFTTAASMASAVALLLAVESAPRRGAAFAAGLFAGAAIMFTQTRGALLCVAVLVVLLFPPRSLGRLLSAAGGMTVVPAVIALYLVVSGALAAAVEDVIWFPLRHYTQIQVVPFGTFASQAEWPWVAFHPVTFAFAGISVARRRGVMWRDPRFRAALALAIVGLLGCYPRPDIVHINYTVPLACPLFAIVVADLLRDLGARARTAATALVIGLCLAGVGYAVKAVVVTPPLRALPTARGLVVRPPGDFTNSIAALLTELGRVPADDPVFFYPYSPMLPYLTGRRHVGALDILTPGYTTAAQFRETCVSVVRDARWVVVELLWTYPEVLRMVWPAMRDPNPPEKRSFDEALVRAFDKVVHSSTHFQVRQRAEYASVSLCDEVGANPRM